MKGAWGEKAARLYLEKRGWHSDEFPHPVR